MLKLSPFFKLSLPTSRYLPTTKCFRSKKLTIYKEITQFLKSRNILPSLWQHVGPKSVIELKPVNSTPASPKTSPFIPQLPAPPLCFSARPQFRRRVGKAKTLNETTRRTKRFLKRPATCLPQAEVAHCGCGYLVSRRRLILMRCFKSFIVNYSKTRAPGCLAKRTRRIVKIVRGKHLADNPGLTSKLTSKRTSMPLAEYRIGSEH